MYNNSVRVDFDTTKDKTNVAKHGISLAAASDFEFETALIETDTRKNYDETRYNALGYLEDRLHSLTFTYRNGLVRAISLRKANKREAKDYETLR